MTVDKASLLKQLSTSLPFGQYILVSKLIEKYEDEINGLKTQLSYSAPFPITRGKKILYMPAGCESIELTVTSTDCSIIDGKLQITVYAESESFATYRLSANDLGKLWMLL